jgi:hypothetical protein
LKDAVGVGEGGGAEECGEVWKFGGAEVWYAGSKASRRSTLGGPLNHGRLFVVQRRSICGLSGVDLREALARHTALLWQCEEGACPLSVVIAKLRPWPPPAATSPFVILSEAKDLGAEGRLLVAGRLPRRGASLRYAPLSMTDKVCLWQEGVQVRFFSGHGLIRSRRGNLPQAGPLPANALRRPKPMRLLPSSAGPASASSNRRVSAMYCGTAFAPSETRRAPRRSPDHRG